MTLLAATPPLGRILDPTCPKGNGLFILYYGDPIGPEAKRVRALRPNFVIVGRGLEARRDVPAFFQSVGTKVLAYIELGYGRKWIDVQVAHAMRSRYDGIFFDEVDSTRHTFNAARAAAVKRFGFGKLVIMNAGMRFIDRRIFDYADIVCVENQWNAPVPFPDMPPWRWMAVQGDPAKIAPKSSRSALMRRNRFRKNGGYWYYAAPFAARGATHIRLPKWLGPFASKITAP